jgi:hypothetical protein
MKSKQNTKLLEQLKKYILHDRPLFWLDTDTSMISGGVKLFLWGQTTSFAYIFGADSGVINTFGLVHVTVCNIVCLFLS